MDELMTRVPSDSAYIVYFDGMGANHTGARNALLTWVAAKMSYARAIVAHSELGSQLLVQRPALCRNVLLAEAKTRLRSNGYFLALDLECRHDAAARLISKMAEMEHKLNVHAITAISRGAYSDVWSLRAEETLQIDYDCMYSRRASIKMPFWYKGKWRLYGKCKDYRIIFHRSAPLHWVESAFNGLAVYKAAAIQDPKVAECRYSGWAEPTQKQPKGHIQSDHVAFHRCFREQGEFNVFIDPSLVTCCNGSSTSSSWSDRGNPRYRMYVNPNGSTSIFYNARDEARHIAGHETPIDWQGLRDWQGR